MGRIPSGEEVKLREEVSAVEGVDEAIVCGSKFGVGPGDVCYSSRGAAKITEQAEPENTF